MNNMRILVYGLGGGLIGGVKTFLFSMFDNMSENIIFDYVIDDNVCQREDDIKKRRGIIYYTPVRKKIFKNIKTWKSILRNWKHDGNNTVYFNVSTLNYCIPIFFAIKLKLRVIVHAHNNDFHNCNFIYKIFHTINKAILKHKNVIRVSNSYLSSKFIFGEKESIIVHNAIDVQNFKFNEKNRNDIRCEYGIPEEKKVYGFVGRLDYQKNPLFLIDVFSIIKNKQSNSVLFLVGDGDLRGEIIKRIKQYGLEDDVILVGSVLNPQIYYNVFDVFVLPSFFEGLGIVLIEAQTNGLPCLATKDKIPFEAKIFDSFYFLDLNNNPSVWADYAIMLSNKKDERNEYYKNIIGTCYDISQEAKKLEFILRGNNNE